MSRSRRISQFVGWLATPVGWAVVVALAVVVIDCATIAMSGPWDPWETHYGEVARQIVVRHDPVDLWWQGGSGGPDGSSEQSFASKPALPFWLMALSMKLFGVGMGSDPAEMVRSPWPELALRLPSMLAGWATALLIAHSVWTMASPRAGVLAGAALATMPQFAIVTRQALTDMFLVAPVVAALLAWLAACGDINTTLKTRGSRWRQVPWDRTYLIFFVLVVCAIVVPLAVIHQHAFDPYTWSRVGRFARRAQGLRAIQIEMIPYWVGLVGVVLRSLRWRRRSQVLMGVVYVCAGLSLMGKGLIGPGLIGVVILAHIVVTNNWPVLRRAGLLSGIVLFALACFPWHHAMALYRGERWVSELIIQNNLQRFDVGEQKQAVGGVGFYLETFGLAALPWSAVVPMAALAGVRSFAIDTWDRKTKLVRFATLWLVVSLFVISYSTTKYYHYLLPCLPPAAVLVGVWLDDRCSSAESLRQRGIEVVLAIGLVALVLRDAIEMPSSLAHLTTYLYTGMWAQGAPELFGLIPICAVFCAALIVWPWIRRGWTVAIMVGSGLVMLLWIMGNYLPGASESWSQRSAMRTYFAQRGPTDRLISWWFYYRGETFFSKGDLWVLREPDRESIAELVEASRGQHVTLWFMTTAGHRTRLRAQLPADVRDSLQEVYLNFHYALLKVQVP